MQIQDKHSLRHYSKLQPWNTLTHILVLQISPFCTSLAAPYFCFRRWTSPDESISLFSTRLENGLPTIDVIAYGGLLLTFDEMRVNKLSDVTTTVSLGAWMICYIVFILQVYYYSYAGGRSWPLVLRVGYCNACCWGPGRRCSEGNYQEQAQYTNN